MWKKGAVPFGDSPHFPPRNSQRGYLLITVVVALFLVATIAILLTKNSAMNANSSSMELETARAEFVAEAGMQHALWRIQNNACMGNVSIPVTTLGADNYAATITGAAAGTSYVLSTDQDAWIRNDQPTTNNGTAITQHIRFESGNVEHALFRFDVSGLAAGSRINSASASFYVSPSGGGAGAHPEGAITVHRVTADWTEANATWNSMNGKFDTQVLAMITPQAATGVWVTVNLTATVQTWVNGAPNYGILLASAAEGVHAQYVSSEGAVAERPRLEVVVGSGAYSPVNLQATGTLANGVTRTLSRAGVTGHQATTGAYLQPSGDTVLKQDAPTLNFGASSELWVEDAVGGAPDNSLLGFNLGVIPSGAWVTSATLEIYAYSDLSTATGSSIGVHRVTRDWVAGTNNGTAGSGATWNQSAPGTSWTSAGSDYDRTPFATVEAPAGSTGWRQWDVTSLLNGWSTGAFPNQGLVLAAANATTRVAFRSSEYSDPSQRPNLTITYACDCGSACLAPQGSGRVLMVVINPTTLVAEDAVKRALLESWGYTVNIISESANAATYASEAANNDVIFISETVNANGVGTKVAGLSIGVVSQDGAYNSDIGFASGSAQRVDAAVTVTDASHYITSVFPAGPLDIYSGAMEQLTVSGTAATGLQTLATTGGIGSLVALEKGAVLTGGGSAAGRRVMLPLGRDTKLNWSRLNNNGRLLVQRALAWGMNADIVAGSAGKLLLVVVNPGSLTSQEQAKKTLIEGWGYVVSLIDESDSQTVYNTALAASDVVFVTEDVTASSVSTKLSAATIGVVIEEDNLSDELGFSAGIAWESGTAIEIKDNTHYITSSFPTGLLTVFTASESLAYVTGAQSADLARLASSSSGYGVVALDAGAATHTGGLAAGRRAMLPWGGDGMNVANLNANGLTIFERAIAWAAEAVDAVAVPVAGPNDDAEELTSNGFVYLDSSDLELAIASEPTDRVGIRFASVGVPQGAVISSAYVQFKVDEATSGATNLVVKGQAADNAAAFTAGVFNISSRPLTAASVNWAPAAWSTIGERGAAQRTPDLAAVIQEVVGRPGWVSGNALAVIITGSGTRTAESYDGDPAGAAVLRIEYGGGSPGGAVGPIAHWKLDDGAGSTAVDSVGGHDGTLVGNPSWQPGQVDGGLDLDGIGDRVDAGTILGSGTPRISVAAWVLKRDSSDSRVISKSSGTQIVDHIYSLGVANTTIRVRLKTTDNGGSSDYNGGAISLKEWTHLAFSYDGATLRIYRNGSETALFSVTGNVVASSQATVLGNVNTTDSRYWNGLLDDVRIYDRALAAEEISALFNAGGGGTFRDEFKTTGSYAGSDGTLAWSGPWLEINESDGANSGDERVLSAVGGIVAQVQDNDSGGEGLAREANLSGYTKASLSFIAWRSGLDDANDYVTIDVSANGGSTWTELGRIAGPGTDADATPMSMSFDISAYTATNTRIRFLTSSSMGGSDRVYFDNVQIEVK